MPRKSKWIKCPRDPKKTYLREHCERVYSKGVICKKCEHFKEE
jgi:hypothetical protein